MKSAAYVYAVTSVYRRLLDEGRCANAEERELLRRAFSRGGFTDGYYTGRLTSGMTGVRSEEDKREYRLVLTDKYYNYIKIYEDSFKASVLEAERDFPVEQLSSLVTALDKMDTAL